MPFQLLKRYTHWLHTQWPAGTVEPLPVVNEDYSTNVPGLYVVGDLTGVPLLKLSANAGTRVVRQIVADKSFANRNTADDVLDVAIIGGGASGFAAAREAERQGLRYCVFEASEPFSTIVNFPKGKPIYTYPTDMPLEGEITLHDKSSIKEGLLEDLREQTVQRGLRWAKGSVDHVERRGGAFELVLPEGIDQDEGHIDETIRPALAGGERIKAHRVVVGIGRSGKHRKLDVPGESLNKVFNRLHDPADFCGDTILVVGGGDSALETAIALTECGSDVTLSYRRRELSRAKPDNINTVHSLAENPEQLTPIEHPTDEYESTSIGGFMKEKAGHGSLTLKMPSHVTEIREDEVDLKHESGESETIENDWVFTMLGREAPLGFFRRSGVRIRGEWTWPSAAGLVLFLLFCTWMYHWKGGQPLLGFDALKLPQWLMLQPAAMWEWVRSLGGGIGAYFSQAGTLGHTIASSAQSRGFYYTLAYALVVVIFGFKRIKRRKTPYIKAQTLTLMAVQVIPLFFLPEIVLPYLGANGVFDSGVGAWLQSTFFPGESWWRAYGLILAWPLMVWNWFTAEPLWGWLVLGFLQTFVIIPAMIYRWGKGAYCGWICSCGALAETLGDAHRHKMPHGPIWNRVNMVGQALLAFAVLIMGFRILGWCLPEGNFAAASFSFLAKELPLFSWTWFVDLFWAGILGVGLYFWYSGRVWCRFACPLAALMHIYARFSQFRILADKKKCISCNVCTSVCHQGIDIMNFANKGVAMNDPECVRCSACVQSCPTGVLSFGRVDRKTGEVISEDPDWLAASPVQMTELRINGKKVKH